MRRHGHRLTVLNDNMGVVLAVQKGRCHNYQLLRVIRRIAAYCLAAGIRCSLRWVPSERNVADKASRVWEETRGDTTANRKQGIQEEESRSVQSERGEKGQRQIDQPCSGREIVARKEPLPLKVEEDRREEAVREGLALDGPVVKGADGARQGATEEVWEAAEGVQGRDELAGDEQHQRASKEGLLQEARRVLRLHCKNQTSRRHRGKSGHSSLRIRSHMYLNGESNSAGHKLKAALEFFRPEAARAGELKLPRFKRSLKGWRRLAPTQTRLPMVEFLKSCISGLMMHQGWHEMALFNEVTFSTYARPGEMMRVMAVDVVQKNDQYHHHVIVLSPFERGISSKTSIFDEVLVLDDTRMPELGDLVVDWAKERIQQEGEEASLWSFRAEQFLKVWRACVQVLEVSDIAVSPYQNRHGGASRDHLLKLRSIPSIQRRGRWATDTSARIYDKPGRLQQLLNTIGKELSPFGEKIRKDFPKWFRGSSFQIPVRLKRRLGDHFKA